MASYTATILSNESGLSHFETGTKSLTFDVSTLKNYVITAVSISAQPIGRPEQKYMQNSAVIRTDSYTLKTFGQSSWASSWSASGLSVTNENKIILDITALDSGNEYGRGTATITYSADFVELTTSPISGDNIARSLANTFLWSNVVPVGSISSQTLYWKYSNETSYRSVNVGASSTEYTFAANTFNNGTINWYIKGVDSSGNTATSPVETVTVGITPSVTIAYPNNVNIRNANQQIFTWEMSESITTGQKSYEIQYKGNKQSQWTTVTGTTSNQYHVFAASVFATDTYQWKLKVTNNDNISTQYVGATFVAIGTTNAPNIKTISNSSIPTITWEISSQDTFEIELYSGSERIYVSGVQVGANVREFTPNIMLEDGNYIVKMRSMNEYGYFTEWSDYAFVLSPQKPESVECMVYANECHGVNITMISGNADSLYVLRRRFGELNWNILGKLKSDEIFVDNTAMTGVKYEYALRNYRRSTGYTDSNVVSMIIEHQGSIVYDGSDFVLLYKTEDSEFQISHTPAKSYSDSYMIGRKYPVRESSEWMAHTTSLSCFVLFEEYEKLERFYGSNDALWFKGDNFSFKCSIDAIQIKETLLGKGYTISIDLSRMDENEVNLLE